MSGTVGYNFSSNTKIKSAEANSNFEWLRGHFAPVTQSGAWNNTTGVYDLGSSSLRWRDAYLSGNLYAGGDILLSKAGTPAIKMNRSNAGSLIGEIIWQISDVDKASIQYDTSTTRILFYDDVGAANRFGFNMTSGVMDIGKTLITGMIVTSATISNSTTAFTWTGATLTAVNLATLNLGSISVNDRIYWEGIISPSTTNAGGSIAFLIEVGADTSTAMTFGDRSSARQDNYTYQGTYDFRITGIAVSNTSGSRSMIIKGGRRNNPGGGATEVVNTNGATIHCMVLRA